MITRKELAERLEAHEARGTVYLGDGRGAPLKVSELKAALLEVDAEIERLIAVCKEHKSQNDALRAENEKLRDEMADYDNAMLRKFDPGAAESTDLYTWITCIQAENEKLRAEFEDERVRHAACGVIAMANTPDSAATQRQMSPKYWTASVQEVAKAVDREMALRSRVERLEGVLRELVRLKDLKDQYAHERYPGMPTADWFASINRQEDYAKNKPKAWAEARAALAQQDEQEG